MDKLTHGLLVVIAFAVSGITVRVWMPGYATMGELQAIVQIQDESAKGRAIKAWQGRGPMGRVSRGNVDVDVVSVPPRGCTRGLTVAAEGVVAGPNRARHARPFPGPPPF